MDETNKILAEQVLYNKTPSVQYVYFDQNSIIKSFQLGFADGTGGVGLWKKEMEILKNVSYDR